MRRTTLFVVLLCVSLLAGETTHGRQKRKHPGNSDSVSQEAPATDDPLAAKVVDDQDKETQMGSASELGQKPKGLANVIAPDSVLLPKMPYRNWDPLGLVGQPTQDARLIRIHVQDLDAMVSSFSRTNEVEMRSITSIEVEGRDGIVRTFPRPANTDYKYVKEYLSSELQKLSKEKGAGSEAKKAATAVADLPKKSDKTPVKNKENEDGQAVLNQKRREHTSWSVRVVGKRDVIIDDPGAVIGFDSSGASGHVTHNYSQATQSFYAREIVRGGFVSYQGNDVALSHVQRFNGQKWINVGDITFKYSNLGAADQKFLDQYHKLEKAYTVK